MRFGPVPVAQAAGLITAHTLRTAAGTLRKGHVIRPETVAALEAEGVRDLVAVRLEPGDVGEDAAAAALADRLAGPGLRAGKPFTGRCNLHAEAPGLLRVARPAVDAVNAVDEAITVATLAPFRPVAAGEMVATVKLIPYAVPGPLLERACAAAGREALMLAGYKRRRVGVVSTRLPALKEATIARTLRVLEERLAPTGAVLAAERRVAHEAGAVAGALSALIDGAGVDLAVVFGASAIADRRDVIPRGIEAAGGRVDHLGMPVDPGNLLLVGARGAVPVIGAPGCARSPKENGFDFVLHRLLADLPVTRAEIVSWGVGGLLTEIAARGQPRGGGGADDD